MSDSKEMPALFADFDITVQDPKERPLRNVDTIPADTLELARWLYANSKRATLSFKGGKKYQGKEGEAAAKEFANDFRDSGPHIKAKPEHTNGVSAVASIDGIVVTVSVGMKRGRTTKNGATENGK